MKLICYSSNHLTIKKLIQQQQPELPSLLAHPVKIKKINCKTSNFIVGTNTKRQLGPTSFCKKPNIFPTRRRGEVVGIEIKKSENKNILTKYFKNNKNILI